MFDDHEKALADRRPEQRLGKERRQGKVRREEIRFKPGKEDRRNGKDRRKLSGWDNTPTRR